MNSTIKRTNEFDLTTMIPQVNLFSFVFWKKSKTPKRQFENNWPLMTLQKLFQPIVICARRRLEAKSWREEIPVEWIVSIKGLRFRSFPGRVLACVCSSTSHSVKTIYGVNIFKCQSYFPKGDIYYKQVYWRKIERKYVFEK